MAGKTAAEALSQYLASTPENPVASGDLVDRLGQVLVSMGPGGLPLPQAMAQVGMSRPDFLTALGAATSAGVVETFDDAGEQKLRLTAAGASLY